MSNVLVIRRSSNRQNILVERTIPSCEAAETLIVRKYWK